MQRTITDVNHGDKQLVQSDKLSEEDKLALFASIVQSSEDAIISKRLDGTITSWNEGAERLFGYTSKEMLGASITLLIPTDRLDEEPRIIERLRKGERVEHFETLRKTKDGRLLDISLTISPIRNKSGDIIGASKIARDISDFKKMDRRKDDFIHMASHELKTPITSMKGYMQLVSQILTSKKWENLHNQHPELSVALTAVNKQVDKMITLISELLNLSRIEVGRFEIHRTIFNVCEFVNEIVRDMKTTAPNHDIIIHCTYQGDITADYERISQVMVNLLSNAIKYSPGADRVDLYVDADEKNVQFSIKDYGIGIETKDHRLIFDRFYRVEGTNEQTFPGFGIGLFVTAEIIQLHGGTISVESEKGVGSCFMFTLPFEV